MARITVEDCLRQVDNMYELVLVAAKRARHIMSGQAESLVRSKNRIAVNSLREIAAGKVKAVYRNPNEVSTDELSSLAN